MSPTVAELRNEIRVATGRFEREFDAQFTKEELVALANEVGYAVDGGSPPAKPNMRAGVRWRAGFRVDDDAATGGGTFVKSELEELAAIVAD